MGRTDWSRLALVSGSFVDEELGQEHCDLLFSAPVAGSNAYFYVLFEHQSTPDPMLVFRLLKYEVRIWERWLRDHPKAKRLPAIIPVVLYNGETPWKEARDFTELLDIAAALRDPLIELLPRFRFLLEDLSEEEDEALRLRSVGALVSITLLALKNARHREDFEGVLLSCAALLHEVNQAPTGREALNAIASYILEVSETVKAETLGQVLARTIGKEAGAQVMTTAGEQLKEQGRQEGRKEGLREGLREGVQEGRRVGREEGVREGRQEGRDEGVLLGLHQALLRMLRMRFGDVPESVEQHIHSATRQETDQWIGQALTAATLDDLFHS